MKKIVTIVLLSILFITSCTKEDDGIQKEEENKVENFIGARSVNSGVPSNEDIYASPSIIYNSSKDKNADGSKDHPHSLRKALTLVTAGKTLWMRGGIYKFTITNDYYYPILTNDGTENNRITIESYPNEVAVIEGTKSDWDKEKGTPYKSFRVRGNYTTIRNIEIRNNAGFGLYIKGHHVIVEGLKTYHNIQTGISNLGANNIIRDNFSYENSDYGYQTSNEVYDNGDNADGIGSPLGTDGTVIEHNVVYGNSDDGIDVFYASNVVIEYNKAYWNGKQKDGSPYTKPDFKGNGQGIKLGGTDSKNNIGRHNIAFQNKASGFDVSERSNFNCTMAYNTSWDNGDVGFVNINNANNKVEHNIALKNTNGSTALRKYHQNNYVDEIDNSWQRIGDVEFISTDQSSADFLRPKKGSGFEDIGAYNK